MKTKKEKTDQKTWLIEKFYSAECSLSGDDFEKLYRKSVLFFTSVKKYIESHNKTYSNQRKEKYLFNRAIYFTEVNSFVYKDETLNTYFKAIIDCCESLWFIEQTKRDAVLYSMTAVYVTEIINVVISLLASFCLVKKFQTEYEKSKERLEIEKKRNSTKAFAENFIGRFGQSNECVCGYLIRKIDTKSWGL